MSRSTILYFYSKFTHFHHLSADSSYKQAFTDRHIKNIRNKNKIVFNKTIKNEIKKDNHKQI